MNNVHGIIFAYHGYAEMGALGAHRTGASMPFCGRYRLIDFALSSMMNAGIHDVGVIMQKGYQSLLDHIGSGRTWDMARHVGGLSILPPYGLPTATKGSYDGNMDALSAVQEYLEHIRQEYVVIERGDLCASVDIDDVFRQHMATGVDITAVCTENPLNYTHHSYNVDANGIATKLLCMVNGSDGGYNSLEMYIMRRDTLLEVVRWCSQNGRLHFHRDGLHHLMDIGKRIGVYVHKGYAQHITYVPDYFKANLDMLIPEKRAELFPESRHVCTPDYIDVSTYYGDNAVTKNCIIADGCIIEGSVENCILFSGVNIGPDASLKNCIILNDTVIGEGAKLSYVVADKNAEISKYVTLNGSEKVPYVLPKGIKV